MFSENTWRDGWLWVVSFLLSNRENEEFEMRVFLCQWPHTTGGWACSTCAYVVSNQNKLEYVGILKAIHDASPTSELGLGLHPLVRTENWWNKVNRVVGSIFSRSHSTRHWNLEKSVNRKHLVQFSNITGKQYKTIGNNVRSIWSQSWKKYWSAEMCRNANKNHAFNFDFCKSTKVFCIKIYLMQQKYK